MPELTRFQKFFLTPEKFNKFTRVVGFCGVFALIALSLGIYSYVGQGSIVPKVAALFLIALGGFTLLLSFVINFVALYKRSQLIHLVNRQDRTDLWLQKMANNKQFEQFELFEKGPISADILPTFYPATIYNFELVPKQFKVQYKNGQTLNFAKLSAIKRSTSKNEKVACLVAIIDAVSDQHWFLTKSDFPLINTGFYESLTESNRQNNVLLYTEKDASFNFNQLDKEMIKQVLFNPVNVYANFNVYNNTTHTYLMMSVPITFMDTSLRMEEAVGDLELNITRQAGYDAATLDSFHKVVELLKTKLIGDFNNAETTSATETTVVAEVTEPTTNSKRKPVKAKKAKK
ncbi:MPN670 family protein [Mycoplasmoides pneumoniae]|uniref:Uncharacterized protein MG456 homolog n=4 Tax=Mycoplasmoides pneumoniae TaxID=2104 RepID=Y670_MYCPN|nr:hypothetical protein [Mycoplasmoides pneumoniae]P75121.1 RecName: Full=Uncharacterized protein MG456 homolog [Mycoplasmoides pneumoniae M129]AAB95820.1 conserved hypothetical protein [Mycoplasmoides pneumoniae M129]ADK86870.1 conserved hypothetical protein [Mycoplasmoides pneumoniae FH]AGC04537.1 hypothetical protein C985_0673 [Mycoplasmoides pneumoniae M129-B7]ALA30534.1 hypothetical protein C897_03775 [Mycoplasmoides pneumoniae PI 1428]ALA30831.1 hypothetical protein B434_01430 [Mycoplas